MTEQETHQGPGVYGGLETHRGNRHECPAPDCGPQGVRIAPNPDDEDGVIVHFPEVDYVDTQVWSADIGLSTDGLRELRDVIDEHLGTKEAAEFSGARPTNSDGSPYSYAQIVAGGWEHCDGCREWGQGWTPENPHECSNRFMKGPVTGGDL